MAIVRLSLILMMVGSSSFADDRRAHVNYMLHCQGCHLPRAEGFAGRVPPMKDFAGYFLHSAEGRDFLIRVPGVANSALSNDEIAELMNWLLRTYSADQLPAAFAPFTATEVATLRDDPEQDPESARAVILAGIADQLPVLATELANDN